VEILKYKRSGHSLQNSNYIQAIITPKKTKANRAPHIRVIPLGAWATSRPVIC